MFIAALFTIAKTQKQPKCTSWPDKEGVHKHTHTHTNTQEYYLAINRNEILPFTGTWMDLEITMSEAR